MDGCRQTVKPAIRKEIKKVTPTEYAADMIASVLLLFKFILYTAGAGVSFVWRSLKNGSFAYFIGSYKRAVFGIGAGALLILFIGLVGGMEAGLISLAAGAPLCIAALLGAKLLSRD